MRKSIKEFGIIELSELRNFIHILPSEIEAFIDIDGNEIDIEDYIENYIEDFFNVSREAYKDIVGSWFMNDEYTERIQVIGYNSYSPSEFFFVRYHLVKGDWEVANIDYNWLQETMLEDDWDKYWSPKRVEVMSPYKGRDEVEMNICSEGMFLLGEDGSLYIDTSDNYRKYSPYKPKA